MARIEGTVVAAAKHPTLDGCRFLVAQRLEADGSAGSEPIVVVDWLGAGSGDTVMVSTDGDIARVKLGNTTPARMVVVGIVDRVQAAVSARRSDGMRLGIVRGHVMLNPAVASYRGRTLVVLEPVTMENLRAGNGLGGGKALIAVDELGAAKGQMVAFTEGREAANPFWPDAGAGGCVLCPDCGFNQTFIAVTVFLKI